MEIDDGTAVAADASVAVATASNADDAQVIAPSDDGGIVGPPWPQPQDMRQRQYEEMWTAAGRQADGTVYYAATGLARRAGSARGSAVAVQARHGLRWGEYYVPDDVLDRWEEMEGEEKEEAEEEAEEEECDMEESPEDSPRMHEHCPEEAEEEAVYSEVFESLGTEFLREEEMLFGKNDEKETGGPIPRAAVQYSDAQSPASAAASLDGLPESVLHRIFCYSVRNDRPGDVLPLERVCRYLHWSLRPEGKFWDQHESFSRLGRPGGTELDGRGRAFHTHGLLCAQRYQCGYRNMILSTLSSGDILDTSRTPGPPSQNSFVSTDDYGDAASNFQMLAERVVAKMMAKSKSTADNGDQQSVDTFRLRGDAVGYLAALLQNWAVERLKAAILMSIHDKRITLSKDDIALLDRRMIGHSNNQRCSVALGEHCRAVDDEDDDDEDHDTCKDADRTTSSCLCPSSDGTEWCWPDDDCLSEDILSAELRYKIVRRLAYRAGVVGISAAALELVAAELLHLLGVLVIDAFEMSRKTDYSQAFPNQNRVRYGTPGDGIDMFSVPPPPTPIVNGKGDAGGQKYTIVPGQIKSAAIQRLQGKGQEVNGNVYGSWWISTPDSDDSCRERERYQESLLYFQSTDQGSSDDEEDNAELGDRGGYATEFDDDDADIIPIEEEFKTFWGGSLQDCTRAYLDEHGTSVRKFVTVDRVSNADGAAQSSPKRRRL